MKEIAEALAPLEGQDLYLTVDPEILDWTSDGSKFLIIQGGGRKVSIPLPQDTQGLVHQIGPLVEFLGIKDELLVAWGIKPFFSYYLAITGDVLKFKQPIFDLKLIESFLGYKDDLPKTVNEAKERLRRAVKSPSWSKLKPLYREIYLPLLTEVVPKMETEFLIHRGLRQPVYSCYEIDGQANGRSKTFRGISKCYLPHSLKPEDKEKLVPRSYQDIFMSFDFNHMEVATLQWLSGDPILGKILSGKRDVYESIWIKATGLKEDARKKAKSSFLPVVFGLGKKGLAQKMEIREDISGWIIDSYYKTYPKAFRWVRSQNLDGKGFATDCFGRRRAFDESNLYKVRNFVVQAPANIICLRKLVKLYESIKDSAKLAFHLHDGFVILSNMQDWKQTFLTAKSALEGEDELFPNLRLTTSCVAGGSLSNLKGIKIGL